MTTTTLPDVKAALRVLRAGFPGEHPDLADDTAELWWDSLERLPASALAAAAVKWAQTETRFPTLVLFLREVQEQARRMARADEDNRVQGTSRCPECDGTKWVEVDSAGQTTVRPCGRCSGVTYGRWKAGHHMAGHDCDECQDLRKGKAAR